jgi:ATP-dependent DNA helicase RecQ
MEMRIDLNQRVTTLLHNMTTEDGKPFLLVCKGFSAQELLTLQFEKLISLPLSIDIMHLDNSKAAMLPEVIMKRSTQQEQPVWCTFEEFLMLGQEILQLYFTIVVLYNNLYHQAFPALYEIPDKERLIETYFGEDISELDTKQDSVYEVFQKYYGDLKDIDGTTYVIFLEQAQGIGIFLNPKDHLEERTIGAEQTATLELSEEEDEFLRLTQQLVSGKYSANEVLISYTGEIESYPFRYRERIAILQELFPLISFVLVTKTTVAKLLGDDSAYVEILKKYWGYSGFRQLRMYKDVHDPSFKKETVLISQSQIIDDMVRQAEIAQKGGSYKDIFVTSPTGAGKSVMFQVPAIYLAEKYGLMTIVISPLIGLMNDQVQGLMLRNVEISATINSEITPAQKLDIMEKIKEGKISILYISPETLLSRSDIAQLIGERKVGLFVIDEAHIVTTWGKAFRSDYWYLGNYLQRLRKEMQFPIATFTATAIYGGLEDMYAETRDSLNLINPVSYFGYIKRDDLKVKLRKVDQTQERFNEYLIAKFKILTVRLEKFLEKEQKTLVYFPTVSLINSYMDFAKGHGSEQLIQHLSYYYGTLNKDQKHVSYTRFKNGEALIMLATKAFGMGIDIPDIVNVYHFAPTGNVCDYIQEIGRAARSLDQGYAYFDFMQKDFVHVNRLHGISTIRKHQLVQVMKKVLQIMESEHRTNHRNLLISAEEFRYIFEQGNGNDGGEDIDNKLKTALLIIEKDYKAKLGYSPLIARPRSVFAKEYFMVRKENEHDILKKHKEYFSLAHVFKGNSDVFGDVYLVDLKKLWETRYRSMSYPQFKYKFHQNDDELKLDFLGDLLPVLQIELFLKTSSRKNLLVELEQMLEKIADLFGEYAREKTYFSIEDVAAKLRKLIGKDKYFCENLASILVHSAVNYERIMRRHSNFYTRFLNYNESRSETKPYTIQSSGYAGFFDWIRNETRSLMNRSSTTIVNDQTLQVYLPKVNRESIEKTFILLGVLEAMGLLMYRANGGDSPEIYLRLNSRLQLERDLRDPQNYRNYILENVYQRHTISVAMMMHLFENEVSNEEFWEKIEDYFLGRIPEEVLVKVRGVRG